MRVPTTAPRRASRGRPGPGEALEGESGIALRGGLGGPGMRAVEERLVTLSLSPYGGRNSSLWF